MPANAERAACGLMGGSEGLLLALVRKVPAFLASAFFALRVGSKFAWLFATRLRASIASSLAASRSTCCRVAWGRTGEGRESLVLRS